MKRSVGARRLPVCASGVAFALLCGLASARDAVETAGDATGASSPYSQVRSTLAPLPGVRDIKFGDFFRRPTGPRGLEPTPALLALAGQRVRLVGYVAHAESSTTGAAGIFILAPVPVTLGDEDEALADDLPPSAVHVHLPPSWLARSDAGAPLVKAPGLVAVTGTLELGAQAEADGRRSFIRLRQRDADLAPAALRNVPDVPTKE